MDINNMKALAYDELRALYRNFLHSQNISKTTINTAYVDTFYLWRKRSKDLFWNAVNAADFEVEAKNALIQALSENSTGNVNSLEQGKTSNRKYTRKKRLALDIPSPSIELEIFSMSRSVVQRRIFTPLLQSIVAITIHSIIRFMIVTLMRYCAILEIVIASQISKMEI